jgi:hypothetical protein
MNPEIRYSQEDLPQSGAVRVLMKDGKWLASEKDRPADWRSRMMPAAFTPGPRDLAVAPGQLRRPAAPRKAAAPNVKAAKPVKPRVPKPVTVAKRRGQCRGLGWNRIADLTIEMILGWQREGLTVAQMSERSGYKLQTINDRMMEGRRKSPEYAAAYAAMRKCACMRSKQARNAVCSVCAKLARRHAARMASAGDQAAQAF